MRSNWQDLNVADNWNSAVGLHGDVFQRLIVKPYLAAMLSTTAQIDGGETTEQFANLIKAGTTGNTAEAIISAISASCDKALEPISVGRVLDLGAGEGFIGRWLGPHCKQVISVDVSEHLLEKGREKASSRDNLTFYQGDLDDPGIDTDFDGWLRHRVADQSISASAFDLFLCINVLDHLEDPRRVLVGLASAMARHGKTPELLLSTLNPDFFLADQTPFPVLPLGESPPAQTVSMGPANAHVEIVPRSWLTMEKIVSDAGFDIVSCDPIHISQYPGAIQQQFIATARLSTNPSAGPFVLWRLRPARQGVVVPLSSVAEQLGQSRPLAALRRAIDGLEQGDSSALQLLTFAAGEPIAY
jgi:2-polyprenyl-3-methyl-5-hydroxy-6-metoxy-1,4-benzoquinol methylase